jgi:cytoskeletal protein RodZ
MKMKPLMLSMIVSLLVGMPMVQSCAGQQRTTTRETTTTEPVSNADASAETEPRQRTTQTTTTSSNEPDSVLGATAHAVGTIILFPFRLIGDAVDLIV